MTHVCRHTQTHVRTHMVQFIISRWCAGQKIIKFPACNYFQITSDLLNSEDLKVAVAQLYHELKASNFTLL